VFMSRNFFDLNRTQEDWPSLTFSKTRERA
jgi:hypothetical protein